MTDLIRNILLLGIAGALVTMIGSGAAYWLDEERRLRRMLRRALGAPPEMVIFARGRGLGAGMNLAGAQVAVLWNGGLKGLVYRLDQLVGAELIVDDRVAARAFRDEPRRALDEVTNAPKRVLLRLVFDNPRDPDFELVLWPPVDSAKIQAGTGFDAIQTARRWVSSVEAILRQTAARPTAGAAPPPLRQPRPAPPSPAQSREEEEPPWDEDE
jgi:hypothetical protein